MHASIQRSVQRREGQTFFRFLMVLSSMAPLFLLLAIRGVPAINGQPIVSDLAYTSTCFLMIAIPALIVLYRVHQAGKTQDNKELSIGSYTDNRDHLLSYLFAMVIPLYQNNYNSMRDVYAEIGVLFFVLFLFTHMNLHYMNIIFALAGYHVFTVETDDTTNKMSGSRPFILLTRRHTLPKDQKLIARRISDTVFIEI